MRPLALRLSLLLLQGLLLVVTAGCTVRQSLVPLKPLVATPVGEGLSAQPAALERKPWQPPQVQQFQLENGLQVYLVERPDAELVRVLFASRRAGADELPTLSGWASMTLRVLAEHPKLLDWQPSTRLGFAYGGVGLTMLPGEEPVAFDALADALLHPAVDDKVVKRIRQRTISMMRLGAPGRLARQQALRWALGPDRGLAQLSFSQAERAADFKGNNVIASHSRMFVPEDSALIMIGPMSREALETAVQRAFGAWPGSGRSATAVARSARHHNTAEVHYRPANHNRARLALAVPAPPFGAQDQVVCTVLAQIFGGLFSSRLNMTLREELTYTYGLRAGYSAMQQDGFITALVPDVAPEAVVATVRVMQRVVRGLIEQPPSPTELAAAKESTREAWRVQLESDASLASAIGRLFAYRLDATYWRRRDEQIAALKPQDIRAAAVRYFAKAGPIVVTGELTEVAPVLQESDLRVYTGAGPGH